VITNLIIIIIIIIITITKTIIIIIITTATTTIIITIIIMYYNNSNFSEKYWALLTYVHTLAVCPSMSLGLLVIDAYSSLSTALCHHLLIFISCRSFSTSCSHLSLGLSVLLPSGLLLNIFLTVLL
jgi:hypothetical protein